MKLTPYSAYKPSGVKWLGDIPAHWEQLPGRACYYEKKSPNTGMQETTVLSLSYGEIVVKPVEEHHGLVPASFETYQVIEPGDIIIRPTDLQNDWTSLRFGLSRNHGAITSAYMCFHTKGIISREYGHLLLHTYDLKKIFYGLGSGLRQNLNWRDFQYLPCLVPPLPEQTAIVCYLNHATKLIDRYISAKDRLINLLEEQRQAVIQRAVTRGLDPNVRLKPSGVEWLGDMPAHWECRRLKTIGRIRYGLGQPPRELPNGLPLIRATNVDHGHIIEKDLVYVDPSAVPEGRDAILREKEIIVVRSGAYTADSAIIPKAFEGAVTGYDMVATITKAMPEFVAMTLLCAYVRDDQLIVESTRSAQPHLNAEELGTSLLLLPPFEEQSAIVEYLDKVIADIDTAIGRARHEIELLKEYRTRLTADVVTGKLDVRETAAILSGKVERLEEQYEQHSEIQG